MLLHKVVFLKGMGFTTKAFVFGGGIPPESIYLSICIDSVCYIVGAKKLVQCNIQFFCFSEVFYLISLVQV